MDLVNNEYLGCRESVGWEGIWKGVAESED